VRPLLRSLLAALLVVSVPPALKAAPNPSNNPASPAEPLASEPRPPEPTPAPPPNLGPAWFSLQQQLHLPSWLGLQAQLLAEPLGNPLGGSQQNSTWAQAFTVSLVASSGQGKPQAQWREADHWQATVTLDITSGNPNLSSWIGAAFPLQQVARPAGFWLSEASISRQAGARGLGVKAGILAMNPDFLAAPVLGFYVHSALNNTLNISIPNFPISPFAAAGSVVEWKASPAVSLRYGLFDLASTSRIGRWLGAPTPSSAISSGVAQMVQLSLTPPGLSPSLQGDLQACRQGRQILPQRPSCQDPVAVARQLPDGSVLLGGYATSGANDGQGLYGVVTLPVRLGVGLDHRLWFGTSQGTTAANNPAPGFLGGGWVAQGMIPSRPFDLLMLGVGSGRLNPQLFPGSGAETVVELGYNLALNPSLSLQPTLQWIANPGGQGQVAPILATGLQLTLNF